MSSALLYVVITYSVALVRKRTIPTERPPLVSEVSANFCGYPVEIIFIWFRLQIP
jgi:hypothetical protein